MAILGFALETWLLFVLAGAAGGAFGAAIGALPSLSLAGVLVLFTEAGGVTAGIGQGSGALSAPLGLGPLFGPHVAFAGGAAAAAYAARKDYLDTDFEYFEAKNIARPLGTKPDVLAVGAAFGVLGVLVWGVSIGVDLPLDPVFLAVVVSGLLHRLTLGFPLVGSPRVDSRLDMSAFDRDSVQAAAMGGEVLSGGGDRTTHGDRLTVEPWLPNQHEWPAVLAIGLVGGVIGAYLAIATGSAFLAFGISAATLLFLTVGLLDVPVTHHVTLPASVAALAFLTGGASSLPAAIIVGALFGVASAVVAEAAQRLLYAHADTHLDPGAVGILLTTLVLGILIEAGVLGSAGWL